ncbi:hypothetical protein BC937DRAFT_93599 [Endogone sp. FLAS-F59071]|nr:hypothetical protein BC937DRAFT_93599 [Endogone sp. FLAS-F59071]|eukprot:RUS23013.1 hypothetical protein BC937DRAFT_93599 [Endogone sp. FLAS-F59071]
MESKDYQIFETTIVLPNITREQYYSSVEWQEAFDFILKRDDSTWRLEYKLDSLYWHNVGG